MSERDATRAVLMAVPGIIREMQAGNFARFPIIRPYFHDKIYALFLAKTRDPDRAENLTQATWDVFFTRLQQYDPERDLASWLRGIAIRELADDVYAEEKLQLELYPDEDGILPDTMTSAGPEDRLRANEQRAELDWVRANLSPEDWSLLEARVVVRRRYTELEQETGQKQRTLQSRVTRLLARARELVLEYRRLQHGWRRAV